MWYGWYDIVCLAKKSSKFILLSVPMKIFSNFDTQFKKKVYQEFVMEYGEQNILLISRSRLFGWLYIYVPALSYISACVLLLVILSNYSWTVWIKYVGAPIVILSFLYLLFPLIKKYIDYKLDFAIISPRGVNSFNQSWIFRRQNKFLNKQNIRTISVNQHGFMHSLFNNGEIIILSEWWATDVGDIQLLYVPKPEEARQKMKKVLVMREI